MMDENRATGTVSIAIQEGDEFHEMATHVAIAIGPESREFSCQPVSQLCNSYTTFSDVDLNAQLRFELLSKTSSGTAVLGSYGMDVSTLKGTYDSILGFCNDEEEIVGAIGIVYSILPALKVGFGSVTNSLEDVLEQEHTWVTVVHAVNEDLQAYYVDHQDLVINLTLGDQAHCTTVRRATSEPFWNETFKLANMRKGGLISVSLCGQDFACRLSTIGTWTGLAEELCKKLETPLRLSDPATSQFVAHVLLLVANKDPRNDPLHIERDSENVPLAPEGRLVVRLKRARCLELADMLGANDPYVVLTLGDQKQRSSSKKNTLKPVWDADFKFKYQSGVQELEVAILHANLLMDSWVGTVRARVQDLLYTSYKSPEGVWLELKSAKGEHAGEVLIVATPDDSIADGGESTVVDSATDVEEKAVDDNGSAELVELPEDSETFSARLCCWQTPKVTVEALKGVKFAKKKRKKEAAPVVSMISAVVEDGAVDDTAPPPVDTVGQGISSAGDRPMTASMSDSHARGNGCPGEFIAASGPQSEHATVPTGIDSEDATDSNGCPGEFRTASASPSEDAIVLTPRLMAAQAAMHRLTLSSQADPGNETQPVAGTVRIDATATITARFSDSDTGSEEAEERPCSGTIQGTTNDGAATHEPADAQEPKVPGDATTGEDVPCVADGVPPEGAEAASADIQRPTADSQKVADAPKPKGPGPASTRRGARHLEDAVPVQVRRQFWAERELGGTPPPTPPSGSTPRTADRGAGAANGTADAEEPEVPSDGGTPPTVEEVPSADVRRIPADAQPPKVPGLALAREEEQYVEGAPMKLRLQYWSERAVTPSPRLGATPTAPTDGAQGTSPRVSFSRVKDLARLFDQQPARPPWPT